MKTALLLLLAAAGSTVGQQSCSDNAAVLQKLTQAATATTMKLLEVQQQFKETVERNNHLFQEQGRLLTEIEFLEAENADLRSQLARLTKVTTSMKHTTLPTPSSGGAKLPQDCSEAQSRGAVGDGVYTIQPPGYNSISVWCDMTTDGGGWTTLVRRDNTIIPHENFNRNWDEYKRGFGEADKEHWLGLEPLFRLTNNCAQVLRIAVTSEDSGETRSATWTTFSVAGEEDQYRLTVSGYEATSTLGDVLTSFGYANQANQRFSTPDRDFDTATYNCAHGWKGGWWYGDCAFVFPTSPHTDQWTTLRLQDYWTPGVDAGKLEVSKALITFRPSSHCN